MYEYHATIIRHIDGDTTHVDVDLGCDTHTHLTVRWYGIDAPELNTPEGVEARAWVNEKLPVGTTCTLHTIKDRREKYGRYLGIFVDPAGASLNDLMVRTGFAREYYP